MTLRDEPPAGADMGLIGVSSVIRAARRFVTKAAPAESTVLLLGPTGSGKEVLARAIHEHGPRGGRFIAVNSANLSEQLGATELFGHERGALTSAVTDMPGKLELAAGGTLFLDEVGEMLPPMQARLLRVLQDREFYRVGGTRPHRFNGRLIVATHRDLRTMVTQGRFREDLYYRLHVLCFELAPLAARREDLPPLIGHLWDILCRQHGRDVRLEPDAIARLTESSYPGNVRELKHRLERLLVLGPETRAFCARDVDEQASGSGEAAYQGPDRRGCLREGGLRAHVEQLELRLVLGAMQQAGHNQTKAARLLRISTGALQYKLRKYGYAPGAWRVELRAPSSSREEGS